MKETGVLVTLELDNEVRGCFSYSKDRERSKAVF